MDKFNFNKLKELDLSQNKISDIKIFENLQKLNLNSNNILTFCIKSISKY